jgi:hypothetical protein
VYYDLKWFICAKDNKTWRGEILVDTSFIQKNYTVLDLDDPISKAFSLFQNTDVIMVMEEGKYKGVIVERDNHTGENIPSSKNQNLSETPP